MGAQVRVPRHYCSNIHNGPPAIQDGQLFFDNCAKFVYEKFVKENFVNIYVACDVEDFYISLSKYFQKKQILRTNYNRLAGNADWFDGNRSTKEIVYNAFLDIFNLSRCDKLICGVSNLTLTSLVVNPNLDFEFYPFLRNIHGY
jgi:hypothetical protein